MNARDALALLLGKPLVPRVGDVYEFSFLADTDQKAIIQTARVKGFVIFDDNNCVILIDPIKSTFVGWEGNEKQSSWWIDWKAQDSEGYGGYKIIKRGRGKYLFEEA